MRLPGGKRPACGPASRRETASSHAMALCWSGTLSPSWRCAPNRRAGRSSGGSERTRPAVIVVAGGDGGRVFLDTAWRLPGEPVGNMRTVNWLFVVSVALFISGIGFVIAGARAARVAAPAEAARRDNAGRERQADHERHRGARRRGRLRGGRDDRDGRRASRRSARQNDEEWARGRRQCRGARGVGKPTADGRPRGRQGDWVTMSRALIDAGDRALKAAEAKSADGMLDSRRRHQ